MMLFKSVNYIFCFYRRKSTVMGQEFNKFFSLVFTKEMSEEVPEADWVY